MHNEVWWENLKKKKGDHLKDLGVDARIFIQKGLQDIEWAWNGFIWLRGEINLGFEKMERISLLLCDSLSFPSTLLHGNIICVY